MRTLLPFHGDAPRRDGERWAVLHDGELRERKGLAVEEPEESQAWAMQERGAEDPVTRFWIYVTTDSGRPTNVVFRIRMDTVEVSLWGYLQAVYDRGRLARWLARPAGQFEVDDVCFFFVSTGEVAIRMPGLRGWALSGVALAVLRQKLGEG